MEKRIKIIIAAIAVLISVGFVMVPYDKLKSYKKRRDFTVSPEPSGKKVSKKSKKPIFVIQKHNASHLHYDFRLEIDGVLVSWAVPKGPSTDPSTKHLAVQTEDHPMDYATFEGMIPEGHYGAGSVIVWDTGTYENIKEKDGKLVPIEKCYKNGRIEIFLHGKKLQGGYALIKAENLKEGEWLLIKMR